MPPLAAAIGAYIGTLSVTGILTSIATSIILGGLQKLLFPVKSPSFGSAGITTQIKQPIMTRKPVYGELRLSGGVLFIGTSGFTSKYKKNKYLHYVIELAPHEIEEIGEVWLNDYSIAPDHIDSSTNLVNTGRYSGLVMIKKHLGTASQSADSDLMAEFPEWTSAHKLSGIAYIYVRLEWETSTYPTGIPNVSAFVKGKKILDTRTSTTLYSNNLALVTNDYLLDTTFGLGATSAEIDSSFVDAAANTCDEFVTTASKSQAVKRDATTGLPLVDTSSEIITIDADRLDFLTGDRVQITTTGGLPGGLSLATNYYVIAYQRRDTVRIKLASSYANALAGTAINLSSAGTGVHTITKNAEPRYTGAIQLDSANEVGENIKEILAGYAGKVVYAGGTYRILAGAYQTPTVYFDENDIVGPINVQTKISRRERFNSVHGKYISPINDGQPSDYPPVSNATYQTEDNGELIIVQRDYHPTQRAHTAQRLAKIDLEKSRQEITWTADFNLAAFLVQGGDNAFFSVARFGWTDKVFEIASWSIEIRDNDGVPLPVISMTMRETASGVYDWDSGEETVVDLAPNTDLPDPFTVDIPGAPQITESLFSARDGGGVKAKALIECAESTDAFVSQYQFRYKLTSAADYITLSPTSEPSITIFDIAPGTYDFGARALNNLGVVSSWVTNTPVEIIGLSAPPVAIVGLTIQAISSFAIMRWQQHTDLDVTEGGRIVFRHSPEMTGAEWSTSVSIGDSIPGKATETVLPLKAGTYLARAYDSSDIPGPIVSVVTKGATVATYSAVTTVTEHPTFTGAKSSVTLDIDQTPDALKLSGAGMWDDIPDIDACADIDSFGGMATSGTYDFASKIDLATVQKVRLESNIKARVVNTLDMFDDRSGNIDDWASFDGDNAGSGDCQIWVAETDDDPNAAPTWSDWQRLDVAEYEARGFKFQARLFSDDPAYNVFVEELSIAAVN